VKKFNRH